MLILLVRSPGLYYQELSIDTSRTDDSILATESRRSWSYCGSQMVCSTSCLPAHPLIIKHDVDTTWLLACNPLPFWPLKATIVPMAPFTRPSHVHMLRLNDAETVAAAEVLADHQR